MKQIRTRRIQICEDEMPNTSITLKALSSLNKESRPSVLGDNSIWTFPLLLPSVITAFGGPESCFSLAIIAFGSFEFIVPKTNVALENRTRSLDTLS